MEIIGYIAGDEVVICRDCKPFVVHPTRFTPLTRVQAEDMHMTCDACGVILETLPISPETQVFNVSITGVK